MYQDRFFLRADIDKSVKFFFKKTLNSLSDEITHLSKKVFYDPGEFVFHGLEQTWIGIFNNAVIKSIPGAATLQEFSVTMGLKKYGRADYFVRFKNKSEKTDLLFEAKSGPENGRPYDAEKMNKWYNQLLSKAYNYYNLDGEKEYYLKKRTFIVAMIFGWMRSRLVLDRVKDQMDNFLKVQNGDETDFCALYHGEEKGIWVYGKVKKASKFI